MAETLMTDDTDPLIEKLVQAAHDDDTDRVPDVEAGDLQGMLRFARALLSIEQRSSNVQRPQH
jgi:hypothetical protein